MSKTLSIVAWILLAVVVVAPVLFIAILRPAISFWENVMSGLLATAGALVGGVPIALWIDRQIKAKESARTAEEERKRERELLELLKEELDFSLSGLARRQAAGMAEIQPLKSDLWLAASSAGKLNAIRSHRLLNRIASAYYLINVVREIEKQAYIARHGATVTFKNGQTALDRIWADARRFDGLLKESIEAAKRDIDSELIAKA